MRKLWLLVSAGAVGVLYLFFRQREQKSQPVKQGREIERGLASWYGPGFQGKPTKSGEPFDVNKMTAAHKTLPMDTMVQVVDTDTGNSVIVRINDRGPFVEGRIIDLSQRAAEELGMTARGVANVSLRLAP